MSDDYDNNNSSSSFTDEYPYLPLLTNKIKFWSYLTTLIPSIICLFFILYHFLFDRTLRNTLNNHVIIIVLIIGLLYDLTIYPWMIYYYHQDGIWERSMNFCFIWTFIDWIFYVLQTILFAWATIERHILIFYDRLMSTKKRQFIFHYLPIIILIVYCLSFYIIVDFALPCENIFSNDYMRCIYFCINDNYDFYMWETIAHQFIPALIIIVSSIALFIRVVWKKIRMHQPIQWRKQRKMSMQILMISFVYLLFYFPYTCLNFMYLCGFSYDLNPDVTDFLDFISYFMMLLLPFACMLTLPNIGNRIKGVVRVNWVTRTIFPTTRTTK